MEYYNLSSNIFNAFDNYVIEGGFAGSYLYKLDSQKIAYINNVIDVVILKDIMKKIMFPMNKQCKISQSS